MSIFQTIFWIGLSLLFFCYLGYGVLLFLLNALKRIVFPSKEVFELKEPLSVTLIIASFNEEDVLRSKIENSLTLKYAGGLNVIFVVDGSTDSSVEIISQYPAIKLIELKERKGKLAAIKRAMSVVNTPIVVFSDANAMLNEDCIQKIVPHYANPKVGGVAGEKKIISTQKRSTIGETEGFYWRYESFMKKMDSGFNTVIGAAGELFSIRTHLFKNIPDNLILDDFVISMNVCLQGYKLKYEPAAYASETPSSSLAEEEKRKVRISAGAYQSIGYLKGTLNFFKHPLLSFQYVFRRLFRWILCPLLIIGLFITNIGIAMFHTQIGFYFWFLFIQLFFYLIAFIGWRVIKNGKNIGVLNVPFYFVFMNYCLVKGFFIYLKGRHTVIWEKSLREPVPTSN
jgi:cellulose synthase/poly-beta-1,6-N-acetylglucosamine synthase-like glycosyltransferase